MVGSILLVSPDKKLGERVRQSLAPDGSHLVTRLESGADVLALPENAPYDLLILDAELSDVSLDEIGENLRARLPELPVLLVLAEDERRPDSAGALKARAVISRTMDADAFRAIIERESGTVHLQREKPQNGPGDGQDLQAFPWLEDVNRAAQYLTRLSLETAAQAALIIRGEVLWAYAGGFPQPIDQELGETLSHNWLHFGGSDLARFIRLHTTGEEYMLYATGLVGDLVLGLVFDARTPFSQIRAQATQLAQLLASGPEEEAPQTPVDPPLPGRDRGKSSRASTSTAPVHIDPWPVLDDSSSALKLGFDEKPNAPQASEPIPDLGDMPLDWKPPQDVLEDSLGESGPQSGLLSLPADRQLQETAPDQRTYLDTLLEDAIPLAPLPYEKAAGAEDIEQTGQLEDQAFDAPEYSAETRPSATKPMDDEKVSTGPADQVASAGIYQRLPLEPASPSVVRLSYACILVPRFPHHHLTSDLARNLGEWIPQICVAFAWRVEHLSVRPDFVQWTVTVPPETSPRKLMRVIQSVTSQRIFANFPRLKDDNPSGEFWAPGYLIVASSELPHPQLVRNFIRDTRGRQGFRND